MRRFLAAFVVAAVLVTLAGGVARAEQGISEEYDEEIVHPLRLAYYVAHPIGYAAEWLFARPFHYIISRPGLDKVFGYQPFSEESYYYEN